MIDSSPSKMRSYNMSRIRSKHTKPEMAVRQYLHAQGLRFRIHVASLPGNPDLCLKKYNTVIFVHGCFWHRHPNCKYATIPKTNTDFWEAKFNNNIRRDLTSYAKLHQLGWNLIIIWECEIPAKLPWLKEKIMSSRKIEGQ